MGIKKDNCCNRLVSIFGSLSIVLFMSAVVLYSWLTNDLTKKSILNHRSMVIDLEKGNILVGSFANSHVTKLKTYRANGKITYKYNHDSPEKNKKVDGFRMYKLESDQKSAASIIGQ